MKSKTFPTTFNYGHLKYKIIQLEESRSEDGIPLGGEHRLHEGKIFIITAGHTEEYKRIVLMHEILHALEYTGGFELEEKVVRGLSFGLVQALLQNPWMGEFFNEN